VVVCDIQDDGGQATSQAVKELGRKSLYVHADVARPDEVEAMMKEVESAFGRLDILVNNAGIEYFRSIEETTIEEWDRTHDVDLKGVFLTIKLGLPLLKKSDHGVVINIASVHSLATVPDLGAYAAAKAGLAGLTRSLAMDLGRLGIRAICVSPGFIDSPMMQAWVDSTPNRQETLDRVNAMHPVGRVGTPEDVGNFIAFACSDLGTFIDGINMVIDGGILTKMHH
jgi:NAD(P)-dependent dehydrogenase (short-subunit alcohol dehydrogenase family)